MKTLKALSIRTRLTLWYAGVLALIILAMAGFLAWRLHADLIDGIDHALVLRAQQISTALQDPEDPKERLDLEELTGAQSTGLTSEGSVTQVISPTNSVFVSVGETVSGSLLGGEEVGRLQLPARLTVEAGGKHYRVLTVRLVRTGNILLVANSTENADEATRRLLVLLGLAFPVVLALSVGGGYLLARRALLPIDRMTRTAAAIGADDSHARLPVGAMNDEVGRLGRTLNDMLDRLQRALTEQRRFVGDASHELRTPLAIMRTEIDVSLRSAATPDAARPVLESASEEVRRMTAIVEGLLTLARFDEGRLDLVLTDVDVVRIATDIVDRFHGSATSNGIRVAMDAPQEDPVVVQGDEARLIQLLTNLVDNAVKYSPTGGEVRVVVANEDNDARISVSDTGLGISEEHVPHVFDRFYRVDEARTRHTGGTGLGLAICRSIAVAHGGDITVESTIGRGSVFTVRFPRRAIRSSGSVAD